MMLNQAEPGRWVQISQINASQALSARLKALGMLKGTKVEVMAKKPSGTLILKLRGTRFALGSALSSQIEVSYV
jgi:ferrous iron transport protein A